MIGATEMIRVELKDYSVIVNTQVPMKAPACAGVSAKPCPLCRSHEYK